jgi:hypothetical protein
MKRENNVHLHQLAKKKYVRTFFFFLLFFSAFLGVSRQGEFENTGTGLFFSTLPKLHRGYIFSGGGSFGFFLLVFLSIFFVELVKRLSDSR